MKKSTLLNCAAVALLSVAAANPATDVKIIANTSVTASEVSLDEVKRVFLITKSSLEDGSHVEPVIEKGGPAHDLFLKEYVGKSDAALNTYYRSLVFTGKGTMPKVFGGDAEVAAYVARTRGAIGYVSADTAAAGVKVLKVK